MGFQSALLVARAAVPFAGCGLDGGCGYESRGVAVRAQISAPASPHVGAQARSSRPRLGFVMATEQETAFPTLEPEELAARVVVPARHPERSEGSADACE